MEIKARSLAFRKNLGIASEKTLFTCLVYLQSWKPQEEKLWIMKRRFFTMKESYGRSCGK